jgi:uncharacterized damage-inducible protein DinB
MDAKKYISQLVEAIHHMVDDAMKDITIEQFNNVPPGTANTISAVFVHLVNSEDFFIQELLLGKPKLWEQGGWDKKTGVNIVPDYGGNWEMFKQMTLAIEPVLAYQKEVRAATDSYLAKLTAGDLDRMVSFAGGERSVASVINLLVCHTVHHAGEISALRGIQGGKGLPY